MTTEQTADSTGPIRLANHADRKALYTMAHGFNPETGAEAERTRRAIDTLMEKPDWGAIWVILDNGEIAGYAAVCYGFSIEFGGRDAILDELYVAPAHRGRGLAQKAIEAMMAALKETGIVALHLEVMDDNRGVAKLYERAGFEERESRYFWRMVED